MLNNTNPDATKNDEENNQSNKELNTQEKTQEQEIKEEKENKEDKKDEKDASVVFSPSYIFLDFIDLKYASFLKSLSNESMNLLNKLEIIGSWFAKRKFSCSVIDIRKMYQRCFTFGFKMCEQILDQANDVNELDKLFNRLLEKRKTYLFAVLEIETILANLIWFSTDENVVFSDFTSVVNYLTERFKFAKKQHVKNTLYAITNKRNKEVHLEFLRNDITNYDEGILHIQTFKKYLYDNFIFDVGNLGSNNRFFDLDDNEQNIFSDFIHFDQNAFNKQSDDLHLIVYKKVSGYEFVQTAWNFFKSRVRFSNKCYNETLFKRSFDIPKSFSLSPFSLWLNKSSKIDIKNKKDIEQYTTLNCDEIIAYLQEKINNYLKTNLQDIFNPNLTASFRSLLKTIKFHPNLKSVIDFLFKDAKNNNENNEGLWSIFLQDDFLNDYQTKHYKTYKTTFNFISAFILSVWKVLCLFALFNSFEMLIKTIIQVHKESFNINNLFNDSLFCSILKTHYNIVSHILTFRNPNFINYNSNAFFSACILLANLFNCVYSYKVSKTRTINLKADEFLGFLLFVYNKHKDKQQTKNLKSNYDILNPTILKNELNPKNILDASLIYNKLKGTDTFYLYVNSVSKEWFIKDKNKQSVAETINEIIKTKEKDQQKKQEAQKNKDKNKIEIKEFDPLVFKKQDVSCPCEFLDENTKTIFYKFKYLDLDFKYFDNKNIDGWVLLQAKKLIKNQENNQKTPNGFSNILYHQNDNLLVNDTITLFIDANNKPLLNAKQTKHLFMIYHNLNKNNPYFKVSLLNFLKQNESFNGCFEEYYCDLLFKILLLNKLKDKLNDQNINLYLDYFKQTNSELDLFDLFKVVNNLYQWK